MALNLVLRVRHDGTFSSVTKADVVLPENAELVATQPIPANTLIFGIRITDATTLDARPLSVAANPTQVGRVMRYDLTLPNGTVVGSFERVEPL